MARQGVSRDQVFAAADALVGDAQGPTIKAVREKLGDTGSPNTIHRHLVSWREARPAATAIVRELPQALAVAIAAEIERTASQVRGEMESELVQERAAAAELSLSGERLEVELEEVSEQVLALTTERDTLAGKFDQQAADLTEALRRIEREQQAAEAARVELATAKLKVESQEERQVELATEMGRLRDALTLAEAGRIAAEKQAAVLVAKLDAVTERASRAEARIENIEQQAAKAAVVYEDARERAVQELRQAQKERDQVREQAAQEVRQIQAGRDEAREAASEARERAAAATGRLEEIERNGKSNQSENVE